eukprot:192055-Hanusia_phi.AAC.1
MRWSCLVLCSTDFLRQIFGPDLHSATNVGRVQEESSGLVPRLSKQILTAVAMVSCEDVETCP